MQFVEIREAKQVCGVGWEWKAALERLVVLCELAWRESGLETHRGITN